MGYKLAASFQQSILFQTQLPKIRLFLMKRLNQRAKTTSSNSVVTSDCAYENVVGVRDSRRWDGSGLDKLRMDVQRLE